MQVGNSCNGGGMRDTAAVKEEPQDKAAASAVQEEPTSSVTQDIDTGVPADTVPSVAPDTPQDLTTTQEEVATDPVLNEVKVEVKVESEPARKDWEPFRRRGLVITHAGTVDVKTIKTSAGKLTTKKLYKNTGFDARGEEVQLEGWTESTADSVADQIRTYFDLVLTNNPKPVVFMFPAEDTLQVRDLAFRMNPPSAYQVARTDIKYVLKLSYGEYGAVKGAEKVTVKALPRAFSLDAHGPFHLDGNPLKPPTQWGGEEEADATAMLAAATSPISLQDATPPAKKARTD